MSAAKIETRIAAMIALGSAALEDVPIPPAVAQECARRWLLAEARHAERESARRIEEAAEREAWREQDAERERRIAPRFAADAWAHADGRGFFNAHDRRKFLGIAERSENPADWERAYASVHEDRRMLHAVDERAAGRLGRELAAIIREGVDGIIEERAAELGIEWTAALLTTTVTLPGGERVPWGEATIAQHEARIDMLAKHATGELETASRHRAAVEAIRAAGVSCLNELALVTHE